MSLVYAPKKKVVSVWRPIEFMFSGADLSVGLMKVKVYRGGALKSDAPVLYREFWVSNGEISGGVRKFKFDLSNYLKEGIEPFDGMKPQTLSKPVLLANELDYELDKSIVPFKVVVNQYVKGSNGEYSFNNLSDMYPVGNNEWMYGVNHSPMNGEDMYMSGFYPVAGRTKFLSDWNINGYSVLSCGLKESLFVSFYIGDNLVEGVRVKRYQMNGSVTTGIYKWNGIIKNGGNTNNKIITSNIGGYGINGLLALSGGMSDLLFGDDVFLDVETLKWEVQFISNISDIIVVMGESGTPNSGQAVGFIGFTDITEMIMVNINHCDNDLVGRIHWLNRRGGMDSKTFQMFARRSLKVTSVRSRKPYQWSGDSNTPNDVSFRSVSRKGIEGVLSYEIEELLENNEGVWLESLLESPCVYMEDSDNFLALIVEDAEIVPDDTDDGIRVLKMKFLIDNTNIKIE